LLLLQGHGQSEDMTAKERLLFWSKQMTDGYVGVRCDNFTTSWRDGRLFNAIIHKYRPDLVDMSLVSTQSNRSNLEQAFDAAEQLGVARLLDPEDVDVQSPDEKSVITYVSTLYDSFPKVPDGGDGINANDVDIKWVEYQNMIKYLSQWIKHNVTVMSDRAFPNNPVELKALYTQYLQFKEHEIPLKENEKTKINHLYEMLEVWIEFGRIQLPAGHHPNDIEKEWGKLIVAMLEREKSLRPEVERLEMLQQIANRVQRDCVNGEDKLSLARTALQSDAKRLEAGIQFQNEAEIAGYLLECENTLRQQVMDIQMLLDGKFPFADQLVQRVSKLRDDLLSLRTECSSVYNQGRTLTAEQTKRMISGISNSLNFAQNANPALSPALSPGGAAGAGSTFTSSGLGPALTPGLQPQSMGGDGGGGGMEPMSLQHLKHAQILKPLVKPSLLDTDMTEGEANMNFVQDLLNWVEEMQVQVDRGEWGTDLPSVETQIDDFKSVHQAIEEFQTSLKEAKHSEFQMTVPLKHRYSEKLSDLESNYEKLLNCSRKRQSNLEKLHDFVSRATQELIWLNEKEEEEVAFDWSDRNGNINNKRDYHADLMRELEEKEEAIKSVQDKAESLMLEQHPARPTIEAYRAAMQTQWNWILQLCSCVEQHLKENAVYFEFFGEAKESLDRLKNLQDAIHRKYSCDRTSSLHKLEDLVQESMEEKEQLLQYSTTVAGLVGRAKTIVQLRPRNPDSPVRSSIPVKAICDYRQIEITIFKDDECVLASNAHRAKWKVINPGGNEAMVPSVCFTVPPPNKEALEMASRIEQTYQNVLSLWHHSHVNMKSVVSWHYLMADIRAIRNWNVASVKTLLSGAHQQEVLSNLDSHFEEFLADSEESEVFTVADRAHSEREVEACKQYYEELLRSAEREEHEESQYNHYISEVRNFRMHLEAHEEHLIRKIRTPLDRDDLEQSQLRISEQEKMSELDQLKGDLEVMKEKCEVFLKQASTFPSLPTLSSELLVLVQNMGQVYSMSSIFMDKLKTVSLVVENSQRADALVKVFESKLYEEDAVNCDLKSIETVISTLKHWRSEMDEQQEVFHDMEDELKKARSISERMFKVHNERDFDLDWHREKADQLSERWHSVHSQIDNRLRELESISKSLKYYKDSFSSLDEWVKDMEAAQLKAQENQPEDSKALAELLNTQKVLVAEIEQKQSRITECQKHSEQYSSAVKDYELQLMTYRAMVDSQHKSPLKKRRMQNSSDAIQQEFMDLRTRYTALVTLMTQCVKFASETLRRAEEEEDQIKSLQREKSSLEQKTVFHTTEVEGLKEQLKINRGKISRLNSVEQEYDDKMQSLEEELSAKQLVIDQLKARCSDISIDQLIKAKLLSQDVLRRLEMGLTTVEEVQATIAKFLSQPKYISGLYLESSKKHISFLEAAEKGILAKANAIEFLEAQAATGSSISLAAGKPQSFEDAIENGHIDALLKDKLKQAHLAFCGYLHGDTTLPVLKAIEARLVDRCKGNSYLEVQIAAGGVVVPEMGVRVPADIAVDRGLLTKATLQSLYEPVTNPKKFYNPDTRQKAYYGELLNTCVYDVDDGVYLLPFGDASPTAASSPGARRVPVISSHRGTEMSAYEAYKGKHISQMTYLFLSRREGEWVEESSVDNNGGTRHILTDGKSGRQICIETAVSQRYLEATELTSYRSGSLSIYELGVGQSQQTDVGLLDGGGMTADEAVQCDLMRHSTTLIVLDKQKGFTGLLIPSSDEITIVSSWSEHRQLDSDYSSTLLRDRPKIAAFYIPENDEVVDIDSATKLGFIDHHTAELLKSIEFPAALPDIEQLNAKFSSWLMLRELTLDGNRASGDLESSIGHPRTPSPSEMRQLLTSYLMMNSYLDTKSEQRLVVLDRRLTNMVQHLVEDLALSESQEPMCSSDDSDVYDISRQGGYEVDRENYTEPGTMMCNLAKLEVVLMADLEKAKELLGSVDGYIPTQIRQDLASSLKHLGTDFTAISQMCTIKSQALTQAIESGKVSVYGPRMPSDSLGWEMESNLQQGVRLVLEDVAFDVQSFVSENTEFLSSAQSKHILKLLSTTQRAFREQTETVAAQRQALEGLQADALDHVVTEKQKEFASKLDELCDSLTLTENRLMGHQHEAGHADSVSDLQQYQQEHQALQKDVLTNAGALNDVISSTKKFLEENRAKMSPEQVAAVEKKLEEAKSKAKLINQRAEESRKDLEKVVTTAIKQESEKTAAVEQLEESKNKIEGLLGWISNIGNEKEAGTGSPGDVSKENGNLPEETSAAGAPGEEEEKEDDANGNGPDTAETDSVSRTNEKNASLDIDKQYDRVKARHQEILSQQQELIMATQSAQALLDKQAQVLAPEEQEKLQRDVQELRARYDASLTQAEQQMKQVQSVQEELGKFQGDSVEFEAWLDQAEAEMEELCAPGDGLDVLAQKLQRQKSFSEDVISHKGDLRFITISGQKVLDVAKACSSADAMDKGSQLAVDTSGSCASVKKKLDSAKYKIHTLNTYLFYSTYFKYSSAELVKWLNSSEEEARRQQSEAIAADPQTLQIQLEDTKSLQGQMTGRQTAVETLRKTSDSLISCEGDLLSHPEAIQEIVDDIAERYDNLSKSVSDRNEKLQITLTRSMSVQDGLDEMMGWMQGLEDSVREKGSVPLDSPALGSLLSKEAALGQDIASRQSSISAIKAKVEKFAETADASAAAPLQSKMESLSRRLADTCDSHNLKVSGLEEVKDKVERFEKTAEEVQQFVQKRSQELRETDGPGKSFKELSQLVKRHAFPHAVHTTKPLSPCIGICIMISSPPPLPREEEVSSCQDQLAAFRTAAGALTSWLEETDRKVPTLQPGSGGTQSLEKDLLSLNGLLEEWTAKGPAVQELNSQGAALCTHISALTSPAKKNGANKSGKALGLCGRACQNMSYVSEGYTTLEGRLRSSAAQLSELLEGVKETQKEADLMVAWLGDMKHKAASGNSEAGEKGSVKAQLEQQKEFEADMKQKQEKLQQLRQKLLHLLETHPDSPEAATWKQMLAEIDAAWDEVTSCAEERKQHLERSSRNLEAFHTAEPQLRQWLSEKELMMTVLGPLSVDLNMLKMQKQQVQILQNEFESRKPQYEELHKAAAAILDPTSSTSPTSPSSSSSEVQAVTEQLAGVTQKWEDVTGQLGSRAGLIDQAALKTGQLQELLKGLGAASGRLDAQLSGEQGQQHSTQPDAVKKQLEQVHSISAQLREERRRLKEAEAVATELTAMVTEDYLKADLARQLESVSKPFKQLEEKRAQQLASTFDSSQQFHRASEEFQTWLDERLREEASPRPVSAQVEPLQRSLTEHEALRRALSDHERPYATIAGEGEALLQDTDGAEKLALQGQLATLSSNWEAVKKGSADRGEALATALQRAVRYRDQAEKLSAWAEECEASRDRVQTAVDPVALESSLSQLKALQKDVDKHRGAVEQLNAAADSLLEAANADTDGVKEERAALGERVDKLAEGLQSKRESLEKTSQTLKDFNDTRKEAKSQIERAQKQVEAYESLGAQAHSTKTLTNMKAQQKSLEAVQSQLEQLKNLAKDLVVDVPDADGVTDLLLQADGLEKDYGSLNKKVEETCSTLEGKLQGIGQFQNDIREMYGEFTDLDDELDGMEPVALDLAALKDQQEGIQGFTTKLREVTANTVNAGENCRKMLETESSPELFGLKRDVDALSKQCGKLLDRARGREEQVVEARRHLEELHSKLRRSGEKLSRAVATEEAQGVVAVETEVINQQLEAFKVFEKEEIEPLQTELQDINSLGQALIQGAAKASSTQGLEDELDSINAKWNTLNKKVAERSAQLHEALLHCGRFQDALESLLSWLTDTEELVANQKAPSAEFKVVKAQIQEQKLLQRLLDDRKPTVELIKKEGGKVAELAESVDRDKVAREMEGLGQRWDTLLKKAENRFQLESILVVTQKFHETLEPLSDWLQATEKHLANSEPIGTESSKLEKQISQQKALEEEILSHSRDLCQALSLGQMLRGAVSAVDDVDLVQVRLDATQASYIELQERCRRRADTLRQALANARLFGEDEVALMNWLSEAHGRLSEAGVQDPRPDALEEQLAEQRALQEDIKLRRQNVDQAIANGMELLKQTTGDEVVAIQGKLDGIKTKYAEIDTMSRGVCDNLQRVLGLSTELQGTHQELDSWLGGVEAEVSSFAGLKPVGEELTQAQDRQKALLKEAKERKPLVDKLNELSGSLLDLVPWHAREGLDKLVTADNERYRALSDAVTQHVDRINADMLKSQQFGDAADAELAWLSEAQDRLQSMGEIRLEQDQTLAQLQAQKVFSMDIMRHKDSVDELVKTGKAIMDSKSPEEKEALVERYAAVCQLNSERCLQLERAQSLAGQFWETYEELCPWLQDTLAAFSQLHLPAIEYETLRRQQEELRQMRELIAEHKPHIDKMNKTGPQLLELSPLEGEPIREKYTATDRLYAKLKADVTQRAATLDEAISKSTQFHDKIDPMLESLERMSERLRQPPSISVEVEKIREQLTENKAGSMDLEKLQPSYEMLRQRGEEMIARSEGADKDLSAKAVQDKLDQMVFLWQDIQALQEEREAKLLDVMDLADKFWCEHCALLITTKDSQDLLKELEEPGVDPSVVKQQLEFVEVSRASTQGNVGLMADGGISKALLLFSVLQVNLAWENLDKTWKERVERLEEAMQAAVQFQDGLQGMFDWVDILESKLDSMPPVGTDVDTVKQQLADLKEYKGEAYQLQIELERLNHAAGLLLKKVTDEADRSAIQEPMAELKMLWDNLDEKIINRQHKLEGGLLALGQFQHALDELLAWMSHTDELLGEQRKAGGDPKAIEIELAKHHVLENDVLAHKTTVETVQRAGGELVQSSAGEEASALQTRLDHLNQRWTVILERTGLRRQQLESSLLQAQGFHGEIEDMQQWLKDTERQLLASKAVGGLPDTAREQLSVHLELCAALEAKEELYGTLVTKGQQLLTLSPEGLDSNTEQDLANLRDKWGAVRTKVAERKVKLEEALTVATDFHDSLQDFINWLTQAEQTLTMVSPASLIMDTVMFQIDEHKMFVTEVNGHRDHIIELDKTGTHLKYFSQKQDVVLIKNLLVSVQARWEKLLQRSVERGRMLDDARKRAKQFHETWTKLMDWLEESEKSLDSEVEIANDPDRIKAQLAQHKEFQKAVGSKHAVYDTTARTGRALKDKTGLKDDKQKLDDMLSELRDKWDTVCGKSVERQNKLEEALLISGQFTEALQALIDWLYKVEPQMAEDQPVHGDIDLVLNLIDNHKVFQKELGKRTVSVAALKRSARELLDSSHDDPTWVRAQMGELGGRWDTVCTLSVSKQSRLEQALGQAEEFHSTVHILLEWLAEAEQSLRFHGSLPDDEDALRALIEQHEGFMKKLEEKRAALNKATSLGEDILTICHPDSITTIKHWNTIIKARFEEVQAWARQHQQRLATALEEQQATAELLKGLLTWLQWAESSLDAKDKEALPQELEEVKGLIAQHQTFMEEMTRKQPDVDIITKTHKRKNAAEPAVQSQIPVLEKGRPGRKRSPTQALYQAASQTPLETKNPQVNLLVSKWQQVWLLALDRRRKLNDALDRLEELKEFDNFDFDVWRKKYMRWMNHKKSRVMDFFRRIDKDQDGKVTREEFIEGILSSRFPTSRLEMSAVADIFDRDGDGFIDYYEFVAALHPNKEAYKPLTDADKIEDEVTRQVAKCKCPKRFQVEQIGANKYRFYLGNQFGDSQQLRLVRILRSTVMVRVGGGWMALDEFLVKNDPCRVHHHGSKMLRSESNSSITQSPLAKGRTNLELREKFILPEGTTQIMASFRYRGRRSSRPSSRAASPNRSTSSHSCPAPAPNATPVTTVTSGTPKVRFALSIVRNYDKPWLVNSKPSSPLKSSDGCGSPGSSSEGTPVQGSKLRLPGYLSGKGFQSGEEGTLINNAVLKARAQAMGERKNPSQPGSRGSSRRGSDASDFDISDIQSVCSDASENVGEHGRPSPRGSAARQHGGKPSKIPTPKRRATPTSKLAKGSKR
uniref:Dystonin n=1 Tax=Gadus morhua TaxID=8049 RepID=A0A8C4Z269_GADMO